MSRKWLRLLACVSLVAFVAANTHAGAAFAACLTAPARHGSPAGHARTKPAPRSCCNCSGHKARVAAEPSEAVNGHGRTPCEPCPGCPKGPCGPKCPCPGGCALCNPAKVPCLAEAAGPACEAPCLGASPAEHTSSYTPPFSGTLTRPPRA
jgi:hypothetical protein